MFTVDQQLGDEAVRRLQALIRIDTTNPPGNETPAAQYLADFLSSKGLDPIMLGAEPARQNVVARLKGDGSQAPLLLAAHLDVVTAEPESWQHPPFSGEIHGGYLWGRGAIDMKHMAVMSALVQARLKEEGVKLKRDLIFAGVADEEAGCDLGSRWLVDNHPELVRAEYALGEAGAFTVYLNGHAVYPVQVAEKGAVWMRLKATGRPGHGSMPRENNAVAKIGRAVSRLASTRLPPHRTRVVERYLAALAKTAPFPRSLLVNRLFNARIRDLVLDRLPDKGAASAIAAAISNTAVPTTLRAGNKINVVPGFAEAEVDGRSLPGQSSADLIREVRAVIDDPDVTIEVLRDMPPVEHPGSQWTTPLWDLLRHRLEAAHPGCVVVPYLAPGFSDAKSWSRLGTRTYGFMPLRFPDDGTKFGDLFHGHNERIPIDGLIWGTSVLLDVVRRFCA